MKNILLLIIFVVSGFAGSSPEVFGQKSVKNNKTGSGSSVAKNNPGTTKNAVKDGDGNAVKPAENPAVKKPEQNTVSLPEPREEEISDETLSGNVIVNVNTNGNAVIKIGLADRAVTLIDFPVNDPIYKIHPGNENFVTVGCFGREPNGKCLNSPTDAIVLRPGKNFHDLGSEESSATVITIQRVSGMVVTFIVVPVKSISHNTNYVAVRYDLKEVVEARRVAGLAVNLKPIANEEIPVGIQNSGVQTTPEFVNTSLGNETEKTGVKEADKTPAIETTLVEEIQKAAANEAGLKFSKPKFGISLARASGYLSRVEDITVEVIAVRNTLPYPIRLMPEQPRLVVENIDSKQTSINIEPVNIPFTATTLDDSEILEPGRVHYFAFAYQTPILGIKQVLRVSFAQREAEDAPATLELTRPRR